jgi:hypothetical protein
MRSEEKAVGSKQPTRRLVRLGTSVLLLAMLSFVILVWR